MTRRAAVLPSPFQPAVAEWFADTFPAPTRAQELGWPEIRAGRSTLLFAPTGSGKTLAAFLTAIDRLMFSPVPARKRAVPRALRLAAAGAGGGRGAQPPRSAGRDRPGGRAPRRRLPCPGDRDPHRRHPGRGPRAHGPPAPRHPDHDAGVPVPGPDLAGAGDAGHGRGRDRGRDPHHGRLQARRPPRAVPGALAGARRARPAAHRPLRDPAPAGGGGALPGRRRAGADVARAAGVDRGRGGGQAPRPPRGGAGRGHVAPGRGIRRAGPRRGGGRRLAPQLDLARDPSPAARAHPRAPLDPHLREQPAPGGADGGGAQRAGGRGAGPRASRLAGPRAAGGDRGRAQGGTAARHGRDLVPRARDRHGRHRPRGADRGPALRGQRPAADRPRRASSRRHVPRA